MPSRTRALLAVPSLLAVAAGCGVLPGEDDPRTITAAATVTGTVGGIDTQDTFVFALPGGGGVQCEDGITLTDSRSGEVPCAGSSSAIPPGTQVTFTVTAAAPGTSYVLHFVDL